MNARFNKTYLLLVLLAGVAACEGPKGSSGEDGPAGPPGPYGVPAAAPVLLSISPTFASEAMTVRITGENFSAVAADNHVFFGGYEAVVDSATATEIVTRPVNGGFSTEIDVTVQTNGLTSNSLKFTLGFSGDTAGFGNPSHDAVGGIHRLADGTVLFTDPDNGQIMEIAADGVVTQLQDLTELLSVPAKIASSATKISILDTSVFGGESWIWDYRPTTNELFVEAFTNAYEWRSITYVGNDLYLLRGDGFTVDRLQANGTLTEGFATFAGGAPLTQPINDLAGLGGLVYAAISTGGIAAFDPAMPGTVNRFTISGDAPSELRSIAVEGADLVATGTFAATTGFATIDVDAGALTAAFAEISTVTPNAAQAIVPAGAGSYVVATGSSVYLTDGTTWNLRAAPITFSFDTIESGGKWYVASEDDIAFVAELADGSYRIAGSDSALTGDLFTDLDPDGANVVVGWLFGGRVDRLNPVTGVFTTVVDHSAVGLVFGFARDGNGNYFIADLGGGNIAKYDNQGMLVAADFITGVSGPRAATRVGTNVWFTTTAGSMMEADPAAGGAAIQKVAPGTVSGALAGLTTDAAGTVFVSNLSNGIVYTVTTEGYLVPFTSGVAGFNLAMASDGRILVGAQNGAPHSILP